MGTFDAFDAGSQHRFCTLCFTETKELHDVVESHCTRCGTDMRTLPSSHMRITNVNRGSGVVTVESVMGSKRRD